MSQTKNTLSKFEQFSLRCSLLKYWTIKNISVLFWSFFIICIGLTFSGFITPETPILGWLFGELSQEIKTILGDEVFGHPTLYGVIEALLSLLVVIGLCIKKVKALSFTDIKSRKCKILLVKAGLWFNEDGKLTKRVEKITKTDIDKDGLIGELKAAEIQNEENIIEGLKRAGEEFVTIVTLDLSEVERDQEEEVYQTVALDDTKAGVDDIKKEMKKDRKKLFDNAANEIKTKDKETLLSQVKTFCADLKNVFGKSEEEIEEAAEKKAKRKEEKEKSKAEKALAKQKVKEAKIAAKKVKEIEKKKQEEAVAAEKSRLKKLIVERVEAKKEEKPQVTQPKVAPANTSIQSQLTALLKNKK